ncbi:hypothetical protein JHK85_036060 [Glycine max]|nr:hypothetical protein JHK85_036060 [Glycine max]
MTIIVPRHHRQQGQEIAKKTKGRGFRQDTDANRNSRLSGTNFDSLTVEGGPSPQRC